MSDITLVGVNAKYVHTSLGIRSLAAYLEREKPTVCVKQLEVTINDKFEAMIEKIFKNRSPIVGFSCYLWNISAVLRLAQALKAMDPTVTILFGGPEVSYDAEAWLARYAFIDAILYGEGERSLVAYWEQWQGEKDWAAVSGLCWRKEKMIQTNEPSDWLAGDDIPMGYSMEALPIAPQIIYYESSRGCPYRCAFCLSAGESLRFRSAEQTLTDMKVFAEAGATQVKFVDRTFNADRERANYIWREMATWETTCNFHFEIAARTLDEESIMILQNMPKGRVQLEIGIQTTHEKTKQAIDRVESFEKIATVVRQLQENNNMHIHLDLIAGLPHEGWTEFERSFCDVYSLQPDMLQLGFLKLLRGSKLRAIAPTFGCHYSEFPPYEVVRTDCLSPQELFALKECEHAVDMYYHATMCRRAVDYLVKKARNAFVFFVDLGRWIKEKPIHKHLDRLHALWAFAEHNHWDDDILKELLVFDYLRMEKRATIPFGGITQKESDFFRAFYREKEKDIWNNQVRMPWRWSQLYYFDYDICHQKGEMPQKKRNLVLFDYQAKTQQVMQYEDS